MRFSDSCDPLLTIKKTISEMHRMQYFQGHEEEKVIEIYKKKKLKFS